MNNITFYSFALSPFALKVHSYLLALGVEFDTVFVDAMKMRTILPIGKTIPVLTINNESRRDSSELGYWLSSLYPEKNLAPKVLLGKINTADDWVNNRLINLSFREALGFDDSLMARYKKRLYLSNILGQTSPEGVSAVFRFFHMLFVGQTFVKRHIAMTDKTRSLADLKVELALEFEGLLEGGPFLCGSDTPTLADLSAYPQIVKPKFLLGGDYFLPGDVVCSWVARIEEVHPNLLECFPKKIRYAL